MQVDSKLFACSVYWYICCLMMKIYFILHNKYLSFNIIVLMKNSVVNINHIVNITTMKNLDKCQVMDLLMIIVGMSNFKSDWTEETKATSLLSSITQKYFFSRFVIFFFTQNWYPDLILKSNVLLSFPYTFCYVQWYPLLIFFKSNFWVLDPPPTTLIFITVTFYIQILVLFSSQWTSVQCFSS